MNRLIHKTRTLLDSVIAQGARTAHRATGKLLDYLDMREQTLAQQWATLIEEGLVIENQFNGLGVVEVPPGETVEFHDTMNRNVWLRHFVLSAERPAVATVEYVSIAGLPLHIGSKPMPLEYFGSNAAHTARVVSRRPVLVGQRVVVRVTNRGKEPQLISAGFIGDELPGTFFTSQWAVDIVRRANLLRKAEQGLSCEQVE